jgi:hypothetical protein
MDLVDKNLKLLPKFKNPGIDTRSLRLVLASQSGQYTPEHLSPTRRRVGCVVCGDVCFSDGSSRFVTDRPVRELAADLD